MNEGQTGLLPQWGETQADRVSYRNGARLKQTGSLTAMGRDPVC